MPKLGQIGHVGCVLKTSRLADFKSAPGFENRPRFVGVIEQNEISNSFSFCHNVYRERLLVLFSDWTLPFISYMD